MKHLLLPLAIAACRPAATPPPSAPDGEDDTAAPPTPTTPFYGLECPVDAGWDASAPWGDGPPPDWLLLDVECALLGEPGDPPLQRCLARTDSGYTDCRTTWSTLGHAPDTLAAALSAHLGRSVVFDPDAPHPALVLCAVDEPPEEGAPIVDLAQAGLYLAFRGLHHVACAVPEAAGVWGGHGAGAVFMAIDPAREGCEQALEDLGWPVRSLAISAHPVAEVPAFRLTLVAHGAWDDLPPP